MKLENNHRPLSDTEIQSLAKEIVQGEIDALENIYNITVEQSLIDNLIDLTKYILQAGESLNSIEDAEIIIKPLNQNDVPTTPRRANLDSYLFPRCTEKAANDVLYRNQERIKPFLEEIKERDCDQFAPDLESMQACIDYKGKADFALGLIDS